MNALISKNFTLPTTFSSYSERDVVFLLKDLSACIHETGTEDREEAIQSGVHYSEMLPVEYEPSEDYLQLFHLSLNEQKERMAVAVGVVAEQIVQKKGFPIVLVSLARAGTPVGILIKRYILYKYNVDLPHYSISIIRDRGLDENAIRYILKTHPNQAIQFIDGWTGKGAIQRELSKACHALNKKYAYSLHDDMAVLADPGSCASIYGTREDFLIPSACLNSTVSGLVSRTVLNNQWIGRDDFHGAKYYKELQDKDVSHLFLDTITKEFKNGQKAIAEQNRTLLVAATPSWKGMEDIQQIQKLFGITNTNLIKPGVGETTRVLLRRVPWKILVRDANHTDLAHIKVLAKERQVPIVEFQEMSYTCCGLIKPVEVQP